MAILITGGAGYIGSHTCVGLLETGCEIVLLDNFSNSKPEAVRRIREITGKDFPVTVANLLHESSVHKLFRTYNINSVVHFAGL